MRESGRLGRERCSLTLAHLALGKAVKEGTPLSSFSSRGREGGREGGRGGGGGERERDIDNQPRTTI